MTSASPAFLMNKLVALKMPVKDQTIEKSEKKLHYY
jgi:hypothetical protein